MKLFELFGEVSLKGADGVDKQLDKIDDKGGKLDKTFKTLKVGTLAVGAAVGGALGFALKDGIGGLIEMEEKTAQLNAVLESTGGKAGITADEVLNLADAFEKTTKFAAESTLEGQNLLLTFTNIGQDVFPQATQTMLDMATAMGTDAKSQAIALGKALNDPIAGIGSLSRVDKVHC